MRKTNEKGDRVEWLNHWLISGLIAELMACFVLHCVSVTDVAFGIVEHVNAAWSQRGGKYEQVNRRDLEMRSLVSMNRDSHFFPINCAALACSLTCMREVCALTLWIIHFCTAQFSLDISQQLHEKWTRTAAVACCEGIPNCLSTLKVIRFLCSLWWKQWIPHVPVCAAQSPFNCYTAMAFPALFLLPAFYLYQVTLICFHASLHRLWLVLEANL